jgi:hypothetical protein
VVGVSHPSGSIKNILALQAVSLNEIGVKVHNGSKVSGIQCISDEIAFEGRPE